MPGYEPLPPIFATDQDLDRPTIGDLVKVVQGEWKRNYKGRIARIEADDKSGIPFKLQGIEDVWFRQNEVEVQERNRISLSPLASGSREVRTPRTEKSFRAKTEKKLICAKLLGTLHFEARRKVGVEKDSVYGAALLMPQLGRSLDWPNEFVSLTISAYCYYLFCVVLHAMLVIYVMKEQVVMDGFSGQMYVCDFGVGMDTCEGDACLGPAGTRMTPPRLYSWDQYATRTFVKDSLKAIFPDMLDDIASAVDPGEYGVESWWCRVLAILVFVVSIQEELDLVLRMLRLLLYVPTSDDMWASFDEGEERSDRLEHWNDEIRVQVGGMPLGWKIWNFVFIFIPKILLWWRTAVVGAVFLMETSAIDDIIVNSVAMGFLLSIDNIITENLMSQQANFLLSKVEDYTIDSDEYEDVLSDEQLLERASRQRLSLGRVVYDVFFLKLNKLTTVCVLTAGLVFYYYRRHCEYKDGRWVSVAMHEPKTMQYSVLNAFLHEFFPVPKRDEPYWTYSR